MKKATLDTEAKQMTDYEQGYRDGLKVNKKADLADWTLDEIVNYSTGIFYDAMGAGTLNVRGVIHQTALLALQWKSQVDQASVREVADEQR